MNIGDLRTRVEEHASAPGSQVITVFSPKGGVGKTFVAVSLAVVVSRRGGRKVLLLDMDLDSGDASVHLDLNESSSITDLMPYSQDLRPDVLARFVVHHPQSGVDTILAPPRPELSEFVRAEVLGQLIDSARRVYQCIVIDTPPSADCDLVYECLEKSDTQMLVVTQDLACLRQARVSLELLRRLGINVAERTHVVVNAYRERSILSTRKIQDFLGITRLSLVCDDRDAVERSILDGNPLVLGSRAAQVCKEIEAVSLSVADIRHNGHEIQRQRLPLFRRTRKIW